MKTYLQIEANSSDLHNDQSNDFWEAKGVPDGWAVVPDELLPAWEQYKPFATVTIENGIITDIQENVAAREAFDAAQAEEVATPTTEDDLMSMAVDHEYRLTLLELGVS